MTKAPIGFWKFVVGAVIALTVLRSAGPQKASIADQIWPAIMLYLSYRWARIQKWWPIKNVEAKEDYKQVIVPGRDEGIAPPFKPINANDLKRANWESRMQRKKLKAANPRPSYVPQSEKGSSQFARSNKSEHSDEFNIAADETAIEVTAYHVVQNALVSNVGTRQKAVRHKAKRQKASRRKRVSPEP